MNAGSLQPAFLFMYNLKSSRENKYFMGASSDRDGITIPSQFCAEEKYLSQRI